VFGVVFVVPDVVVAGETEAVARGRRGVRRHSRVHLSFKEINGTVLATAADAPTPTMTAHATSGAAARVIRLMVFPVVGWSAPDRPPRVRAGGEDNRRAGTKPRR
jgi:hypothetical protein